jgi:exonuclease VII small subunit
VLLVVTVELLEGEDELEELITVFEFSTLLTSLLLEKLKEAEDPISTAQETREKITKLTIRKGFVFIKYLNFQN